MAPTSLAKLVRNPKQTVSSLRAMRGDVAAVKAKQNEQARAIRKLSGSLNSVASGLRGQLGQQLSRIEGAEIALASELHAREALSAQLNTLATKAGLARLEQAMRRLEVPRLAVEASTEGAPRPPVDETDMPARLYLAMEDVLRGDPRDIAERQSRYVLRLVELLPSGAEIADLGCGRGEFVTGLKDAGFNSIGVDTNADALDGIRELGIPVENIRADHYLESKADSSLDGVTAFHLIEHIPTAAMVHLFEEAFRVLRPGGVLVLETPNPENVRVGAHTFWLDPTHLKPVPPLLIETLLRDVGFVIDESLRLSPYPEFEELLAQADGDAAKISTVTALYGPQDFGVIARKLR